MGDRRLDWLQEGLDWAGLFPGLGAIPDVANAGISAARDNWEDAAFDHMATIPGFGDAAKGTKKTSEIPEAAAKFYKSTTTFADASRAVDSLADASKGGLVIGRNEDLLEEGALRPGERTLLPKMTDNLGSRKPPRSLAAKLKFTP